MSGYKLTSPCANCPFRNDIKPYLRPDRIEEMERDLVRGEFHCHKSLDYSQIIEDGDEPGKEGAQHCAGALILMEKMERPSQMMRICERIGLYDARKLKMDAPVYDCWDDMITAAREQWSSRRKTSATPTRRSSKRSAARVAASPSPASTTPSASTASKSGSTRRAAHRRS